MSNNHKDYTQLQIDDKEIILIGTAHVSKESAELVADIIQKETPDSVCVELCESRFQAIQQKAKPYLPDNQRKRGTRIASTHCG